MLVLSRNRFESIEIGDDIRVEVIEVTPRGRVRLGVTAPRKTTVFRSEVAAIVREREGEVYETAWGRMTESELDAA